MKTILSLALVAAAAAKTDSDGWTLLVKQDSSKGDFFPKSLDGEYNIDHPEDKLYSHLDVDYSKFKSTDGKMTLQLRWPTIVNAEKTLTWRQSSSPMAAHGKVTGYEIERGQEHDWSGNVNTHNNPFNGMAKSFRFVAPLLARPCYSPLPSSPVTNTVRAHHTPAFFSMPPSACARSWTARRRTATGGTRSAPTVGINWRTAPRLQAFPVRSGLARQWPPIVSSTTSSFG